MPFFLIELPIGKTPNKCTPESGNGCELCGKHCGLDNYKKIFPNALQDVVNNGVIEEEAYFTDIDDVK